MFVTSYGQPNSAPGFFLVVWTTISSAFEPNDPNANVALLHWVFRRRSVQMRLQLIRSPRCLWDACVRTPAPLLSCNIRKNNIENRILSILLTSASEYRFFPSLKYCLPHSMWGEQTLWCGVLWKETHCPVAFIYFISIPSRPGGCYKREWLYSNEKGGYMGRVSYTRNTGSI